MSKRDNPGTQIAWAIYNMGNIVGVCRTRNAAILWVEEETLYSWEVAKHYMEVRKVSITPDEKRSKP